jgi:hypothetical protein
MKVLFTATVQAFFRLRAGMFFVILGILFGFLSSREHYAFAVFFLTDPHGMYYLLAIWLIYAALCSHFIINLWAQPEYMFIYQCRLWTQPKRFWRFFLMSMGLLQPILYYGIYVTSIAGQDHLLGKVWPMFCFFVLLGILVVAVGEWRVRTPFVYGDSKIQVTRWPFPRPVSWVFWSLEWLVREKGVTLLICKLGAAGVALGTISYYGSGNYDLRLPAVGTALGYLLNVGLSYELYRWENEILMWNRSLPVTYGKRFLRIFTLHAVLIIPETLIVVRQNLLGFSEVVQLYGLGLSALVLFHTYLYRKHGLLEDLMKPVLFGYVLLTLVILYKVPLLFLILLFLGISVYRFPRWYGNQAG